MTSQDLHVRKIPLATGAERGNIEQGDQWGCICSDSGMKNETLGQGHYADGEEGWTGEIKLMSTKVPWEQ